MANDFITDFELYKFCIWRNRTFRNDSSAYSLRGILKSYFCIHGRKAEALIKRLVTLGYAEFSGDDIKIMI